MMDREAAYVALFDLLMQVRDQDGNPLKTYSRYLRHWYDTGAEMQPALFLAGGNERHNTDAPGLQDRIAIMPKIYIYVRTEGGVVPGTVLNPILDQVQAAFTIDNPTSNKCTLGGKCQHARIDGEILTFEGTLGDQEVAIIPLEILLTNSTPQ